MQPLVSCAKADPLPNLKVNAWKQLNLQIFFQTRWHLLIDDLVSIFLSFSSSHVNATNFAGFIAHLFEQTYDHNSAHTAGSLRRVNTLIWQPQLDSGNS